MFSQCLCVSSLSFGGTKDFLLQRANPGILGGIVKGLRAPKPNNAMYHDSDSSADFGHLEEIFERNIIAGSLSTADEPEAIELTIGFTHLCLFLNNFLLWYLVS